MQEETKNQLNMVLAAVSILALATAAFWWTNGDPQPVADVIPGPTISETVTVTLPGSTATVTATKTVRATRTVTVTPKPSPKPTATPRPTSEPTQETSRNKERTPAGFNEWLNSPTARLVLARESHGICTAVNPSGKYRGRWQMSSDFWSSYGGLEYASTPDRATCHEQDLVAYRGWLSRGWQPWPTAQ